MTYKLKWKVEAEQDFNQLNPSIQKSAFSQFKKLKNSPQLGKPLGNKAGLDLTGYRKLYFCKKQYRIIYKLEKKTTTVIIFAIGKREGLKAYRKVIKRIISM